MRRIHLLLGIAAAFVFTQGYAFAQSSPAEACPRPGAGSVVSEPEDLRSKNGVLKVELTYLNLIDANGQTRYCYLNKDGAEAPNLRVLPSDWLILTLKNDLKPLADAQQHEHGKPMPMPGLCGGGIMDALATNLHFHGLSVPPVCHQDDVLSTVIAPNSAPFEYRFQIPQDQPPGLYWYHPHIHGFAATPVLGGASGALVIEGIERANRQLGGLPERVFIVRDQNLLHPDAQPATSSSVPPPPILRDSEGDILNTGTGGGKPAKDLSINFVPVPYPDYPPALIAMKPGERQLWRVLNASAITYLDLQVLFDGVAQPLAEVSLDGVPLNENDLTVNHILWTGHLPVPPGGRVEFVVKAPVERVNAQFITRTVDTGPDGENDPDRPLAKIVAKPDAPEPRSTLPASPSAPGSRTSTWLGDVKPVRTRKLYFSERPSDPKNPNSPTVFMITVEGQEPMPYDPQATAPNIVAQQGDVEDWIIENRTRELHAFHIHQLHFLLVDWNGVPIDEPYLRDTVNVSYWSGQGPYPSVQLRIDFRDPNTVGTFPYHCHLLEHEDGGMMGTIRVVAAVEKREARLVQTSRMKINAK